MPDVYLFLSTGRCGTQWLADVLASAYPDRAVVTHEPIAAFYRSARFFRQPDRTDDMLAIDAVANHLDAIDACDRTYIETGWPSYAAIPLFRQRFGDRLRVIHVVRHPIHTAMSYVTLGVFAGRNDDWMSAFLDPWAPGVVQTGYRERWPLLSPLERVLFTWSEVHAYAEELEVAAHHRAEDLFAPGGLEALAADLQLPAEPLRRPDVRVDEHRFRTPDPGDPATVYDHPAAVRLAERWGYDLDVDRDALMARYQGAVAEWRARA